MSDSVRPRRWQPTRLPRPWDSPGKNTGVGCHFPLQCMKVKSESEVAQSCPTLSDLMDCSPPGSSVHGILQARVLEWGAIRFSLNHLSDITYIHVVVQSSQPSISRTLFILQNKLCTCNSLKPLATTILLSVCMNLILKYLHKSGSR